jgi:tetratricopeptide (TPR) repeat protein
MKTPRDYCKFGSYWGCALTDVKYIKERIGSYQRDYQKEIKQVEEQFEQAKFRSKKSLDDCIAYHQNPLAYVNRGLFDYLEGDPIDALFRIRRAFENAEPKDLAEIKEQALLIKGRSELEAGLYADAVLSLTELINIRPEHHEAYFDRAEAYFSLGNFDASLKDYLQSEVKFQPVSGIAGLAFSKGLTKGIIRGAGESAEEFIPSLLSSARGIGQGLWALAKDPVPVSKGLVQAAQECILFIKEHTAAETLLTLVPEVRELVTGWDTLKNEERGELTGRIIGKYGVDILLAKSAVKAVKSYRDLKRANNAMTFESMALSPENNALIRLEAERKALTRKEVLQQANLKIQPGKQGKHLENNQNYVKGGKKSILAHPDPQ